ncbi:hypothetical protein ACFDTO_02645 [Microbacteriaceae bacterium 4G12]
MHESVGRELQAAQVHEHADDPGRNGEDEHHGERAAHEGQRERREQQVDRISAHRAPA